MMRHLSAVAAAVAVLAATAVSAVEVNVAVQSNTFAYQIALDGVQWFASDVYAIRQNGQLLTNANGGIVPQGQCNPTSGSNGPLGPGIDYTGWEIQWDSTYTPGVFATRFYVYNGLPCVSNPSDGTCADAAVIFEQEFPFGLNGTAVPGGRPGDHAGDLITSFPTFGPGLVPATTGAPVLSTDLGYMAFSGVMSGASVSKWNASYISTDQFGSNGGVVVLFNQSLTTVVMSSLNDYMVSGVAFPPSLDGQPFGMGYFGPVDGIPAGTKHWSIMYTGQGINNTMAGWGQQLLKQGGKTATAVDADFQTNYLSYWTDNGAYYYYLSENNKTYEATLLDVQSYMASIDVPIRSMQFDSWWYWKGPNKGALLLWEPMPSVFPDGMSTWLGLPLALHNRYFSDYNNYTEMGYTFLRENPPPIFPETNATISLPVDVKMFQYIMLKAKEWGMTMYEQDWLNVVYQTMDITQTNFTAAHDWLHAMGDAAASLGITIQYCMSLPIHMLESTSIQAVTNSRASGDYHPGSDQWSIGMTSMFYQSIGIQPSKDDFWTTQTQPGNPYGPTTAEPNWQLQAIVTTLSTGPVGPSDMVGGTNSTLLMSTCRPGDGLLLRPDKAAVTVDSAFQYGVWGALSSQGQDIMCPDVLVTYSAHHDHGTTAGPSGSTFWKWYYLLNVRLGTDFVMPWSDLGLSAAEIGQATSYTAVEWFNIGATNPFSPSQPLTIAHGQGQPEAPATAHDIRYHILAPTFPSGWSIYGEMGKITTMSRMRSTNLTLTADGFTLSVHTSPAETEVVYTLAAPSAMIQPLVQMGVDVNQLTGVLEVKCVTSQGADVTLVCGNSGCTCE